MIPPMIRGCLGALLAFTLVATACSDDDDADTSAITSIPDDTTSTTSTTEPRTVAPDVIPDDESLITEDYVQGVLNGYSESALDAFLATRAAGGADEIAIGIVDATSTEPHAVERINSLADVAFEGFAGYRSDPGPIRYDVQSVTIATRTCIVAAILLDSSALLEKPVEASQSEGNLLIELLPATQEQRSGGLNPTAWVIDSLVFVDPAGDNPDCEITN